jgi:hypothetical protein
MDNQAFSLLQSKIQGNLAEISEIIDRAASRSGRAADEISILAISKRQPVEVIEAAYSCGQRAFGESYVQEALEKMTRLQKFEGINWEMVGHVQSRKARQVAENFHTVHSLDSLKLADLLNRHRSAAMLPLEVFLEVNIGDESSKTGFSAKSEVDWEALVPVVREISGLNRLKLMGLMAMPPLFQDPKMSRPYFLKLRQLRDYLNNHVKEATLDQISAGTSADFEVAIEEGSTVVRIGERLLGPRTYTD